MRVSEIQRIQGHDEAQRTKIRNCLFEIEWKTRNPKTTSGVPSPRLARPGWPTPSGGHPRKSEKTKRKFKRGQPIESETRAIPGMIRVKAKKRGHVDHVSGRPIIIQATVAV